MSCPAGTPGPPGPRPPAARPGAGRPAHGGGAVFDVGPGVNAGTAVPAHAGVPLGAAHTEVDGRRENDWAALAALQGPLVLRVTGSDLAQAASGLTGNGFPAETPVAVTAQG